MNAFEWPAKGRKVTPPSQPAPDRRPASMLQPVDYVDETDYEPGFVNIPCGQHLVRLPAPAAPAAGGQVNAPVPAKFRDAYVAADQDLFWLAEHGELERAAQKLAALRAMVEARKQPPEWARYSARCCRNPTYSTVPFTFNDGCGAGTITATAIARNDEMIGGETSAAPQKCNCDQAGKWGATGRMPEGHVWYWRDAERKSGYLAHRKAP